MDFLRTEDVAEKLGVSIRQVQRLARDGRIPHVRNGRFIRIPRPAWEQYLAAQTAEALSAMRGEAHAQVV